MRPSSLLRPFASKLSACSLKPSPVVPWPPPVSTPFDRWLTAELDELRLAPCDDAHSRYTSAMWLFKAADLAVAAQKRAVELVRTSAAAGPRGLSADDRRAIDGCLEDVIELLDACSGVRHMMEVVRTYAGFLSVASHYLEGEACEPVVRRARAALDSCEATERRSSELEKRGPNLRKLREKLAASHPPPQPCDRTSSTTTELHEALNGCRALALLTISMLGLALSFKSPRGLLAVSRSAFKNAAMHELHREVKAAFDKRRRGRCVVMDEVEAAVSAARSLRNAIASWRDGRELRSAAAAARRRWGELEEMARPCGEKVDELHRQLISVRVSLLGKLSEA